MAASRTLPLFPASSSNASPSLKPSPSSQPSRSPKLSPSSKSSRSPSFSKRRLPRLALAQRPPGPEPQPRRNAAQLWLALHLSRLSLDALTGNEKGADPFSSVAVLDPEDRLQSVLACNDLARARGVRRGQPLNAALAFDATLRTLPRDAFRERRFLERLAAECQRFTPFVSIAGLDELLLEVKGSLHLFGGANALLKLLGEMLRAQGIEASLALTPTPLSALWLSRGGGAARGGVSRGGVSRGGVSRGGGASSCRRNEDLPALLARLPLACLRWPEEVLERLTNMGVRDVGDLARLPRAGLARRIGPRWLEELERAFGRRSEVRRRFEPRERFDDAGTLEYEIETAEGLKSVIEPLLARLQRFLRVRGAALGALVFELRHRSGPATRVRIGLAMPTGDADHLRGLLRERLGSLELRAPVTGVRLRSGPLRALQAVSAQLPHAPVSASHATMPDALPRLVERLQARLGRTAVFGLSVFADHRPELAWRAAEMSVATNTGASDIDASDTDALRANAGRHRPLWLLAEPQAHDVGAWRIESGPERIESGWWDGDDVARDYFVARDRHGARGWLFRERRAPQRWFLQGWFG